MNRNAAALMKNNKIATRLAELRKPAIEKAQVTRQWVMEGLKTARLRQGSRSCASWRSGRATAQCSAAAETHAVRGKIRVRSENRQVTDRRVALKCYHSDRG